MRELKLFLGCCGFILLAIVLYQLWPMMHEISLIIMGLIGFVTAIGTLALVVWLFRFTMPLIERGVHVRHQVILTNRERADIILRNRVLDYAQCNRMQIDMPGMRVTHRPGVRVEEEEPIELPEKAQSLHPSESLQLSPEFSAHADDVLSGRGIVFGVSGSGKSNTIAVETEELGRLRVPMLLADTEDEYSSLCAPQYLPFGRLAGATGLLSINSYEEAFNFGGYLLDQNLQVILNLASYPSDDEAGMAMVGIVAGIKSWEEDREVGDRVSCMFILDEASVWLPQNTSESRLSDEVLNQVQTTFFSDLVRRGRKRGMGLTLATQRPAEIDKRALQSNWKVLHRQTEDADLKRYGIMGLSREETLSLSDGEAFVFTSKVSKKRVQLRRRNSPHGANTPGLASIRNRQKSFETPEEIPSVTEMFRNPFDEPAKTLQGTSLRVVDGGRAQAKIIPDETRKRILAHYRNKVKRTDIQERMDLNGDEYWMVKAVCDEYDRTTKQEA